MPHRFKEIVAEETGTLTAAGMLIREDGLRSTPGTFFRQAARESELVEMLSGKELTGARLLLNQAGIRSAGAYAWPMSRSAGWLRSFCRLLSSSTRKSTGMPNPSTWPAPAGGSDRRGICCRISALRWRIRKRQEEITDSLPDALDLLVVCVEAGLGLNASFVKITEEFSLPALLERGIRYRQPGNGGGKPRQEALRALSDRTGVEDVKSLVAMLIQTEKLGTSLSQSLRVHSDSLRTRRRQRAEEAAAKTTIKLVFPLVFLMFPALFIVILGPGS